MLLSRITTLLFLTLTVLAATVLFWLLPALFLGALGVVLLTFGFGYLASRMEHSSQEPVRQFSFEA